MAEKKRITREIEYEQGLDADHWKGTAEQLVAAGVCEQHQLPGEPGRNKTAVTYGVGRGARGRFLRDADYLRIIRSGSRFMACRGISQEEQQRRRCEYRLQQQRDEIERQEVLHRIQQQRTEAEKHALCEERVSRLLKSEGAYRDQVWKYHVGAIRFFLDGGAYGESGYRFTDQALSQVDALLAELREIVETGGVIFDPDARNEEIRRIYEDRGLESPALPVKAKPMLRLVK